jgi:hypothetical protein
MMALVKKITPSDAIPLGLIILSLLCLSAVAILWILPLITTSPQEGRQQELAKELGVEVDDFPYPHSFPAGYFFTLLKPGMPVSEVHKIVQGYDRAFRCGTTMEAYYYFSENPEETVSFWVFYDKQGGYRELQSEGESSKRSVSWCSPGLLQE